MPAEIPWGQLLILFGYALVTWSIGNGLLPLLPVIAAVYVSDRVWIGLYLAASYVALALGTTAAGLLADRLGRRKTIMILSALAGSPLIVLISQASTLWELAVLTASAWCLAGMALTLATIQAGLVARPQNRGTVLGVLAFAAPLGSVVGGSLVGPLADAFGYSRMWTVLGLAWLLCPALALFVHDPPRRAVRSPAAPRNPRLRWTLPFSLLLACGVLGACGTFLAAFGRSLAMQGAFSRGAITSTAAVSGVVALPFTVLAGWTSDRRGRIPLMVLCYAAATVGLLVYSVATSLAAFWVAASLVAFISYVSGGVGAALVVDLVDRRSLGRGLALFGATGWVGAILAFGGGGFVFSAYGREAGFVAGAVMTATAAGLLLVIGAAVREASRSVSAKA